MDTGGTTFSFTYDGRGNLTSDNRYLYRWDSFNRITNVVDTTYSTEHQELPHTATYLYDAEGRRVARLYEGQASGWVSERAVYDGAAVIEEYQFSAGATNILRRYFYDGDVNRPCVVQANINNNSSIEDSADEVYRLIGDERGSVLGIVDKAGNIVEKLHYNTTGLCKSYQADDSTATLDDNGYVSYRARRVPFGYCGMYIEPFTGKGHTLYRDYDALHNMWLSRDPIAEQGGINLTGYCNGNAVDGCDPLGLADTPVGKIVEAVTPFYYIEKYSQFCADSARWIGRKVPVLEKPMESVAFASDFNANAIGTLNVANQVEGFSGTSANRIETDKIIYKRSEGQAVGNALNLALLDINPVAQIIQGTYGKSLEPTSPMVEMSGAEQATRISGGIGGTAGIVAGGLRFAPAIESKIASMRTQTPSPTTPPNGVSQPTETVILSGHGSLEGLNSSPVMQLPKNTSLTVLTEHGGRLPNSIANMIEANGQVTRAMLEIYPELQGARTYLPESFVPDYTLWPIEDSMVIGNPMRVSQATTLSQLIKPNKNYIWNACARDRVKVVVK